MMQAAVWYRRGDVRIEEVPKPKQPSEHDVVIEVIYCGICGTDLHEYMEGPVYISNNTHPLTGRKPPIIIGHEAVGRVIEIGTKVTRVNVGDRVTLYPVLSCRTCHWCLKGRENQCDSIGFIGFALDGGFAEYMKVPEFNCFKVPDGVSDEEAALIEPVAAAVRAVQRAGVRPGQSALIIGAGPIGLAAAQAARAFGADPVIVLDKITSRLQLAKELGADYTLDSGSKELFEQIKSITKGLMPHYVFECVGINVTAELAFKLVSKDGLVMILGVFEKPVTFNPTDIINREFTIMGNMGGGSAFDLTMRLIEKGQINVKRLVTGKIPLEQLILGFEDFKSNKENHLKILVTPIKKN